MECGYTHLNHHSLVSPKNGHQGHDYEGGLWYGVQRLIKINI
jgi:hypothetical protein